MFLSRLAPILILVSLPAFSIPSATARELTFEERVDAQEAIERVYYAHRIGTTRRFEDAVPRAVIEAKVRNYLQESIALQVYWKTSIDAAALAREADRMARHSRLPGRLLEIEAALGNDRGMVLECLARRTLADRLAREFFAFDTTIHSMRRLEAQSLRDRLLRGELDARAPHALRQLVTVTRGGLAVGPLGRALDELAPDDFEKRRRSLPGRPGTPGPILEERDAFVVHVLLDETKDAFTVATYAVPKLSWDEWWERVAPTLPDVAATPGSGRRLAAAPAVAPAAARATGQASTAPDAAACQSGDTWNNGILDDMPDARTSHTAVWTGTEMIVWGGRIDSEVLVSGSRYDPATDTWEPTSRVGVPSPRYAHTAVWTGTRMIVWGGVGSSGQPTSSGGRYDPITDTWSPTSFMNAASPRHLHTAVWTGSRMIVWGGVRDQELLGTGGLYDPGSDTWSSLSLVDAPEGRWNHSAIWTGSRMLVWGGSTHTAVLDSGGLYDAETNSWSPTAFAGAPAARHSHTAVWTGSQMLVWGGMGAPLSTYLADGARYDPAIDRWSPLASAAAPEARAGHTAVWTGTRMIVWGGYTPSARVGSGGVYDAASDTWKPTTMVNAPPGRINHTAVWTGRWMIVWGGFSDRYQNGGARYDPAQDTWTPTFLTDAPAPRYAHTAVWTGDEMIVWGGAGYAFPRPFAGGRYDPALDAWFPTSLQGTPTLRRGHTAIWTGDEMIVWGGDPSTVVNYYGARYDPTADAWIPISAVGAPAARFGHTAVWSGSRMLVWGGTSDGAQTFASGSRYDAANDTWEPMSTVQAPAARANHSAVWTGTEMIVWGGVSNPRAPQFLQSGGKYDPATDSWSPTSTTGSPAARLGHTAVWSGDRMILWGGTDGWESFDSGARYDPGSDTWTAIAAAGSPSGRRDHTAVWTGTRMIVWGGSDPATFFDTGGVYDPARDLWTPISTAGSPYGRSLHTAIWTGDEMIVWGGLETTGYPNYFQTGGRYRPDPARVAPIVDAGPDQALECAGPEGTPVTLRGEGAGCGALTYTWTGPFPEGGGSLRGAEATVTLGVGEHRITLTLEDEDGQTATDTLTITVRDTMPPVLELGADPAMLWPPNHALVPVSVLAQAHDACDAAPAVTLMSAMSNEPDDDIGGGDGHTTGDIQDATPGTLDTSVLLRAERGSRGNGRIYTLTYMAADASGNRTPGTTRVFVPRDR